MTNFTRIALSAFGALVFSAACIGAATAPAAAATLSAIAR